VTTATIAIRITLLAVVVIMVRDGFTVVSLLLSGRAGFGGFFRFNFTGHFDVFVAISVITHPYSRR
jgi:hypothetical protein